jgi:hypothetical protein
MLRLAELAARECDGNDGFSVPVLIAAIRQRSSNSSLFNVAPKPAGFESRDDSGCGTQD